MPPVSEPAEDDDGDSFEARTTEIAERIARRVSAPKPPVRRAKDDKPVDVVKLAKARLRQVEVELRRMRKLEVERDKLRRLVEAADNRPRAVVRDIKRSAG